MGYRDHEVGHVYIMLNPAIPGLVKIGRTRFQTKARARQLYSTGVPKEFIVLWQENVHDSDSVERELHRRFKDSRVNPQREFFEIELNRQSGHWVRPQPLAGVTGMKN